MKTPQTQCVTSAMDSGSTSIYDKTIKFFCLNSLKSQL
jgi:hypothetical protein